jgi:UDP-N-acetylmuramate dehydrogenase
LKIQTDISLLKFNTFGINVTSKYFIEVNSENDLREIIVEPKLLKEKKLVLGGGSNILFTRDFEGAILKNNILGLEIVSESTDEILVKAGAGENWHQFVISCIEKGYGGLENLSLIPGNVGASPMQNIGAYGVEVKDCVEEVTFLDMSTGENEVLKAHECKFAYRSSIFKTTFAGEKFISHVTFRLKKNPRVNTSYGAINDELDRLGLEANIKNVSRAVMNIRRSKLPDPRVIGNAGSFFKNPVIEASLAAQLKSMYPDMPNYVAEEGMIKIPAGWLIEKQGWKGKRIGNYGVHTKQALVLVNYGGARGKEINQLATDIQDDIYKTYGILLEKEVNIM